MTTLEEIKLLLGITDNSKDDLLNLLIKNATTQVLSYLTIPDDLILVVPDELSYIVSELVVIRYNRIGSEGLTNESVDGYSATYSDDMTNYILAINAYLNTVRLPKTGVVRFL